MRYRVITKNFDIIAIDATEQQMQPYIDMGIAVKSLPKRSYRQDLLYSFQHPLYDYYIADPDNFEDCLDAYPILRRGLQRVQRGEVRGF